MGGGGGGGGGGNGMMGGGSGMYGGSAYQRVPPPTTIATRGEHKTPSEAVPAAPPQLSSEERLKQRQERADASHKAALRRQNSLKMGTAD